MSRRPPPPPANSRPAPPPSPPPSDDDSVPPPSDDEDMPPSDEDINDEPPDDDDEAPPSDDEGSIPASDEMSQPDDFDEEPEEEEFSDEEGDFPDEDEEEEPEDEPEDDELSGGSENFSGASEGEPEDDFSEGPEGSSEEEGRESDGEPESEGSSEPEDFDEDDEPDFDDEEEPESEPDIDEMSLDGSGSDPESSGPEEDSPPTKGKKGKDGFVLPVKRANKPASGSGDDNTSVSESGLSLRGAGLDALSSGLAIKQPPKLLPRSNKDGRDTPPLPPSRNANKATTEPSAPTERRTSKRAVPPPPPPSSAAAAPSTAAAQDATTVVSAVTANTAGAESESEAAGSVATGTVVTAAPELVLRDPEVVRAEALESGYLEAQGKFEGDEFESLFVKVDTEAALLRVLIAQGLPVEFDLSSRAFVFEDSADPTAIILDYRSNIVVFKFATVDALLGTMKKLPQQVFMVADLTAEEKQLVGEREAADKGKSAKPSAPKAKGKYDAVHAHGTSVEDLLEQDFDQVGDSGKDQLEKMFGARRATTLAGAMGGEVIPPPRRRAELAESHIRKPQYSVRRVTLLCEWINALHIWPNPVTVTTLHREICNGLLLARIVKTINPSAQFVNLNERALAKKPALENLEQALGHIWRSKSLNSTRIPTANDIYVGHTSKTAILLNELFGAYVQRPLYKNAVKILKWYHTILKQYNRPMPAATFDEGDLSTVWPHFQSGTALFCVIFHLFGPNLVGEEAAGRIRVDPLRVAGSPTSICDFRNNLFYVFTLLEALKVDVIWTPEDWISNPDTEFIMLQLSYIYEAFKFKQSALPPAQGATAGMTSGPNGEPLVVGMIFLDSRPANARLTTAVRKAVLLGHDADSMPLLPVDRAGKSSRFISSVCPRGMVSNNAQLAQISVSLRENRLYVERTEWNKSAATYREAKDSAKNAEVVGLLREHNKRNVDGSSTLTALATAPTATLAAVGETTRVASSGVAAGSTSGKVYSAAMRKIATDPQLQQVVAVKGQEIEVAVQNLEDEMRASEQQINTLEDGLANRYLDLEASAPHISEAEYEAIFEALESERRELGDEKLRLQTHFSRKLESIKDIYSEAEQRVRVSQIQQQQKSPAKSPVKNKTSRAPAGITATIKSGTAKPINKAQAEKGWVSQLKPTAHNYHLKHLQTASQAAVEACWTPKYVKTKEAARKQQQQLNESTLPASAPSPAPLSPMPPAADAQTLLTPEEQVAQAFTRFKRRLHKTSARWLDAKNGGNRAASVHDLMNASTPMQTVSLVSLPEKSLNASLDRDLTADQREELAQLARTIRTEESARMQYEDERRRLVIAENSARAPMTASSRGDHSAGAFNAVPFSSSSSVNSGSSSHRLNKRLASDSVGFAGAAGVHTSSSAAYGASAGAGHYSTDYFFETPINLGHSPSKGTSKGGVMHFASKKPTQPEVDAAFKWLSIPRPLIIAERTPKEFVFSVAVAETDTAGMESKGSSSHKSFVLEWREGATRAGTIPELLAGCVQFSDVKEIAGPHGDNDQFSVAISSSARALKNSKGRTVLAVKCGSPGECAKYLASLRCIRRSYDD